MPARAGLGVGEVRHRAWPASELENAMGEWSEYLEDFPEENPVNYVGGRFDPTGANEQHKAQQDTSRKTSDDQKKLDAEIAEIVRKHKTPR